MNIDNNSETSAVNLEQPQEEENQNCEVKENIKSPKKISKRN